MRQSTGISPTVFRLLCCPFCGGDLNYQGSNSESFADVPEYAVLVCNCDRYPIVAGIPILKKGKIGIIGGRPCEAWQVINQIEAGRHREALLAMLLPAAPPVDAAPGWQEEAAAFLTRPPGHTTVSDLVNFYFNQTGGWSEFTSTHYFLFRFGQPRQLMALSLASLIQEPRKPVLDLACGLGQITRSLIARTGEQPVIGLDRSFFVLYLAKNWVAPNGQYVCGDADASLPFRDGVFSAAFCTDTFHVLVNRLTCIRELKRLTQPDGTIVLVGLPNKLVNKHPTTLPIEGYERLVADMPHRFVTSADLLSRYLQKQGPSLARRTDMQHVSSDPWLSLVASHRQELFRDYGSFEDWPHADGSLKLNPLYTEESRELGVVQMRRKYPSSHYVQQNEETRYKQFQPETIFVKETVLHDLAQGKRTREVEGLIEQCVVVGMPERYLPETETTERVAQSKQVSGESSYIEKIERIKISDQIATLIPPGTIFILVDQGKWGVDQIGGRHAIPFPERDGKYCGLPQDDAHAIKELERLRRAGAGFMVFTEAALWWFHYYFGFRDYLRSNCRCVFDNDRLIVFDLRSPDQEIGGIGN